MIAVPGRDMAAWDALAKAAGVPLCVLLGGSVGAVKAYNSNGLWLRSRRPCGGGDRAARRRRLRRAQAPARQRAGREDLATVAAIRKAVGDACS